jgi:hypothetical protein
LIICYRPNKDGWPQNACIAIAGSGYQRTPTRNVVLHAQAAYFNGVTTAVGHGFAAPRGVRVDEGGNVFIADYLNKEVKEIVAADLYSRFIKLY